MKVSKTAPARKKKQKIEKKYIGMHSFRRNEK